LFPALAGFVLVCGRIIGNCHTRYFTETCIVQQEQQTTTEYYNELQRISDTRKVLPHNLLSLPVTAELKRRAPLTSTCAFNGRFLAFWHPVDFSHRSTKQELFAALLIVLHVPITRELQPHQNDNRSVLSCDC